MLQQRSRRTIIKGLIYMLFMAFCLVSNGHGLLVRGGAGAASSAVDGEGLDTIDPVELLGLLKASKADRPLVLSVGPKLLFQQAHIAGAEYVGAASTSSGIDTLRARVKSLPRDRVVVLYCGCCPWSRCPNVRPAYKELLALGFTRVKLLRIEDDFGTDWVNKGYPSVKVQ